MRELQVTNDTKRRVFITDLAAYNEGLLTGKWVELPLEHSELALEVEKVLETGHEEAQEQNICLDEFHEEYFITDYEGFKRGSVDEYENIYALNDKLNKLESLEEEVGEEVLQLLVEEFGLEQAIEIIEEGAYSIYWETDGAEIAREYLEQTGALDNLPEQIKDMYIDFKSIFRDWRLSGETYLIGDNLTVQVW